MTLMANDDGQTTTAVHNPETLMNDFDSDYERDNFLDYDDVEAAEAEADADDVTNQVLRNTAPHVNASAVAGSSTGTTINKRAKPSSSSDNLEDEKQSRPMAKRPRTTSKPTRTQRGKKAATALPTNDHQNEPSKRDYNKEQHLSTSEVEFPDGQMRNFILYPHPKTVREAWDEWMVGTQGQPAIQALEEKYGSSWRADVYGRTWIKKKRWMVEKVQDTMADLDCDADEAIKLLDREASGMKNGVATFVAILKKTHEEAIRSSGKPKKGVPAKSRVKSQSVADEEGNADENNGSEGEDDREYVE